MNKILFEAKIHNLYSTDYEYLQDNIDEELKKLYRQLTQNPGIAAIIRGFNLKISTTDPTKITIYHKYGWGGIVTATGEIIDTQDVLDPIAPSDSTTGTENFVYIRYYKVKGTFDKKAETVIENEKKFIDLYDYSLVYDREIDKWEVKVYTQAELLDLSVDEIDELICLGSFIANGTDPIETISEKGRVTTRLYIPDGSITTAMISSTGMLLPQYNVDSSIDINDNFSGEAYDLEDNLNELRTAIKEIKGTVSWKDDAGANLQTFDYSINRLHNNGTIIDVEEEQGYLLSNNNKTITIKTGKALVEGVVITITSTGDITFTVSDAIIYNVGDYSTKTGGEDHIITSQPSSFMLAHAPLQNLHIIDKANPSREYLEDVDYSVNEYTGEVTILVGGDIINETISCFYEWGYAKYDAIDISSDGVFSLVEGTPSANPEPPEVASNTYRPYLLYRAALDHNITEVIDARKYIERVREVIEIHSSDYTIYRWCPYLLTYFKSDGSVDVGFEEWSVTSTGNKYNEYATTTTSGTKIQTVVYADDDDEIWLRVDNVETSSIVTLSYESVPNSGILDQSNTIEISSETDFVVEEDSYTLMAVKGLTRGYHRIELYINSTSNFKLYSIIVGKLDLYYKNTNDIDEHAIQDAIGDVIDGTIEKGYLANVITPQASATPDWNVRIPANFGFVRKSTSRDVAVTVAWDVEQTIDCSVDKDGNSTLPSAGNKRYITAYVEFDSNNNYAMKVVAGAEAASPSRVQILNDEYKIQLFEVLLDENAGTTGISEPASWNAPGVNEIDIQYTRYRYDNIRSGKAVGVLRGFHSCFNGECAVYGCSGSCYGIYGQANNYGVYGQASVCYGVIGCATTSYGIGGYAPITGVVGGATTCIGVHGYAPNYGIIGYATVYAGGYFCAPNTGLIGCAADCGVGYGCCGIYARASCCIGIYAQASCSYGVIGCADKNYGVVGYASNYGVVGCSSCWGVKGESSGTGGVLALAQNVGVYACAHNGSYGVCGIATECFGVYGCACSCRGVEGYADVCVGVFGGATNSVGVFGSAPYKGVNGYASNTVGGYFCAANYGMCACAANCGA